MRNILLKKGLVIGIILLFVGTGIGGGVVTGGRLLKGCDNTSGELGRTTILMNGRHCHCPNKGCLEAYAGGWAIAERAQEAVGNQLQVSSRRDILHAPQGGGLIQLAVDARRNMRPSSYLIEAGNVAPEGDAPGLL